MGSFCLTRDEQHDAVGSGGGRAASALHQGISVHRCSRALTGPFLWEDIIITVVRLFLKVFLYISEYLWRRSEFT